MGVVSKNHSVFAGKFQLAVLTGWTTGMCGSLTTFSSWTTSLSFSVVLSGTWEGALNGFAEVVLGLLSYFAAFKCGWIVGEAATSEKSASEVSATCDSELDSETETTVKVPQPHYPGIWASVLLVALYGILLPVYLVYSSSWVDVVVLPSMWAPAGALSRWLLGKNLNKPQFPFGTLTANLIAATAASCIQGLYWHASLTQWWKALSGGLLGSLSTISSFVAETCKLSRLRG